MRREQTYTIVLNRPDTNSFLTLEIEAKDFDNACCQALHGMDEWVIAIADTPIDVEEGDTYD